MKKNAFTVLEILIAVVIILVLVGLLFTGIRAGLRKAESVKTGYQVRAVAFAWGQYIQEFSRAPGPMDGIQVLTPATVALLCGSNVARRVWLDGSPASVDAWGHPLLWSYDLLGQCPAPDGTTQQCKAICWSIGNGAGIIASWQ